MEKYCTLLIISSNYSLLFLSLDLAFHLIPGKKVNFKMKYGGAQFISREGGGGKDKGRATQKKELLYNLSSQEKQLPKSLFGNYDF